jgi:hypothetical protein
MITDTNALIEKHASVFSEEKRPNEWLTITVADIRQFVALARRVPELESALKPFAEAAEAVEHVCSSHGKLWSLDDDQTVTATTQRIDGAMGGSGTDELSVGDFRAARAALAPRQITSSADPTGSQTEHSSGGLESAEPERRPAGTPAIDQSAQSGGYIDPDSGQYVGPSTKRWHFNEPD